jgi:phage tail P2-like protein
VTVADESLLPLNATAQERALDLATSRVGDVPVMVRQVWNPDTCPLAVLPWLAWAYSVDNWNAAWTEAQKRAAIKNSVYIHRHKGTAGAVKTAIASLGYDATGVVEWFQKAPMGAPYTFEVDVTVNQVGIPDTSAFDDIVAAAESAKNVRSHLTGVNVLGETSGQFYFGCAVICGETVTINAES